jgi:hypothetical protein
VWITQSQTNGIASIAEITMAASYGGPNQIGSGTASASGVYSSPANDPGKACDGDTATCWAVVQNWASSAPSWWEYDFGSGNDVGVLELKITAQSGSADFAPYTLTQFLLQYSDDDATWITEAGFTSQTAWTAGSQQTFQVPVAAVGSAHRYWRYDMYSNAATNTAAISETTMASTKGGSSLFGGGTPYASSAANPAGNACDGNIATFWAANNGFFPAWWAYDFGSGVKVVEATMALNTGITNNGPTTFSIDYSDDNVAWLPAGSFTASAYVGTVVQTFDLSVPSTGQKFLSCGMI